MSFGRARVLTGEPRQITIQKANCVIEAGIDLRNTAYLREIDDTVIRNHETPKHMNCAVFLRGIPIIATTKEIIDTLTEGKILSFFKKPAI